MQANNSHFESNHKKWMERKVMISNEKKLLVLSKIGKALNEANVIWAVGGSLLLYFKGKAEEFHDIDIMTTEENVECVRKILIQYGTLSPKNPDVSFKTKAFLEFTVDEVEIDVMSGFVIVNDGLDYDCSLCPENITDFTEIYGVKIPLQSLADWRKYYQLMGRTSKVALIDL